MEIQNGTVEIIYWLQEMIAVKLLGGMGNQMFQYAAARSLALKHDTKVMLDLSALIRESGEHTYRQYALHNFMLDALTTTDEKFSPENSNFLSRLSGILSGRPVLKYIREKSFTFDEGISSAGDNTYLDGYFQSPLYFANHEVAIRNDFRFRDAQISHTTAVTAAAGKEAVFIHIRRGDYVSNPKTKEYHGVCDAAYYEEAIRLMNSVVNNPEYFIFSDEPAWARENFGIRSGFTVLSEEGSSALQDFCLMRSCSHAIIANSSFSWWAAWLIEHPRKKIIAPQKWFDGASHDTRDLIPGDWLRI